MLFYASRISNNISKTPEGYLLCSNVSIARTGVQKYLGQELGLNDKYDEYVPVYRLEEDVFEKAAMASFEGKSVTDNHPFQPVDVNNNAQYDKGHVQNIRRVGDELVGDIIIKDPNLISVVENNVKREISCGYNCQYEPYKDGYRQIDIRGNHVAIVDKGRAGSHVCIKDSQPERRTEMSKKQKVLAQMFKAYARDASPEEIADAMEVIGEQKDECAPEVQKDEETGLLNKIKDMFAKKDEAPAAPAEEEPTKDDEPAAPTVEERLAKVEEALSKLMAVEKEEGHEELQGDEAPAEEEPKKEGADAEEEQILDADPEEEKKEVTDSLLTSLKPIIAKMKDAGERKMITDALKSSLRGDAPKGKNGYATIVDAMQKSALAKSTNDSMSHEDLGKKIAAKYNPHYKKEN